MSTFDSGAWWLAGDTRHPRRNLTASISPASACGLRAEYLQPAASRNRWQHRPSRGQLEPRRSVPAFGFIGPVSPYKFALSLPSTVFPYPKTTTKADYFLHLLPAPVIVWILSSTNRSKNSGGRGPRPKRQYTITEADAPLASNGGDGYDLNDEQQISCPFCSTTQHRTHFRSDKGSHLPLWDLGTAKVHEVMCSKASLRLNQPRLIRLQASDGNQYFPLSVLCMLYSDLPHHT